MAEMSEFVANLTNYMSPDKEFRFCCRVLNVFRHLFEGTWVKGRQFLKMGVKWGSRKSQKSVKNQ